MPRPAISSQISGAYPFKPGTPERRNALAFLENAQRVIQLNMPGARAFDPE